VEVFVL